MKFEQTDITRAGFRDVHGFKDFLGMVAICAPDRFLHQDWRHPDDQLTLVKAFQAMKYGFELAGAIVGHQSDLVFQCNILSKKAFEQYQTGNRIEGMKLIRQIEKIIAQVPTK